jgi:hypothetical protein
MFLLNYSLLETGSVPSSHDTVKYVVLLLRWLGWAGMGWDGLGLANPKLRSTI